MPKERQRKIAAPSVFIGEGDALTAVMLNKDAMLGINHSLGVRPDMAIVGLGGTGVPANKHGILSRCIINAAADGSPGYLEIGSQFGASAILAAKVGANPVVAIDPMEMIADAEVDEEGDIYGLVRDGYRVHYGERDIFLRNMRVAGVDDVVVLVQAFSQPWPLPPEAEFGVTYIDGDHSEEATYADFQSVRDITSHYIIMDDNLSEPGVTRAVQRILREDLGGWILVYSDYRVAVFAREDLDEALWEINLI